MKRLFILFTAAFAIGNAIAQDVIYCSANDSIVAKVLTVNNSEVSYKLAGYEDGPLFTAKTDDIVAIRYANGMYQYFADSPSAQKNAENKVFAEKTGDKKKGMFLSVVLQKSDIQEHFPLRWNQLLDMSSTTGSL